MNVGYILSGGAPVMKRFKVGATVSVGQPVLSRSTAGVAPGTATGAADAVGTAVDTGTYTTTQATSMVEGVVTTVINPDAVLRALMVSAATGNTQLVLTTNSAAATNGLTITITTGDPAPNSPEMAGGTAYGVSGNNVGISRVITSTTATTAVLTVPFPYTIAASDTFILIPFSAPGDSADTLDWDTAVVNVRGDLDAAGGALVSIVDVEWDSGFPRSNSKLHYLLRDHAYGTST